MQVLDGASKNDWTTACAHALSLALDRKTHALDLHMRMRRIDPCAEPDALDGTCTAHAPSSKRELVTF
jgi:hypothetical protein